jgi:hypothetical protein
MHGKGSAQGRAGRLAKNWNQTEMTAWLLKPRLRTD